jgi:hypothetical protein
LFHISTTTEQISHIFGEQRLNISLDQMNVDEKMLTVFIVETINSDKPDMLNLIKRY